MVFEDFENLSLITLSNLSEIRQRAAGAEESAISELAELAYIASLAAFDMIEDGAGVLDVLSYFSESLASSFAESDRIPDAIPENIGRIKNLLSTLSELDKVIFTELFLEKIKALGIFVDESVLLEGAEPDETVTYVKSALADEAYDVFSQSMKYPRVAYSADLKQACLAVREDKAGYCILPVFEKGSSRIPGISALLFSSDLKLVSVSPVFGMTGDADVVYGLASRGFSIPRVNPGDDRYFEILLPKDASRLFGIFLAAKAMKTEIYGISSQSFDTEEGRADYYSITLKRVGVDFSDFIAYLILFMPDFLPTGLYLNFE